MAHVATLADVNDAEAKHRELAGRLAQARGAADAARQAGDAAALASATAEAAALETLARDALAVADSRRKEAAAAGRAVTDIEAAAATLRRQIDALAGELGNPRNEYTKRVWAAEAALQQAQHSLDRAKREQEDAAARLSALREQLAALA